MKHSTYGNIVVNESFTLPQYTKFTLTSSQWTRTGPKVVFEYFRSLYDLPFKSSSPCKLKSRKTAIFLDILANLTTFRRVFLTEMVTRHIYGPTPFIWAYNQVCMTLRSKVLARTSSSLEKPLFWAIWPLPVGCFWPKWSKGTSTGWYLSFEPFTKSLWPSVQKF